MIYQLVADPAVEGNFFLKGGSGETKRSFPYAVAYDIQTAMEVGYNDGIVAGTFASVKTVSYLIDKTEETNAIEAIKVLDIIGELVKAGETQLILDAIKVNRNHFEEYMKARQGSLPKSNQE